MAKRVKWNTRAIDNFYDSAVYFEETYSKTAAENFVEDVITKIELIKKHPTIGRKAPNRKTIRFILVCKHFRLYYRIHGKTLIISSLLILVNILIKILINNHEIRNISIQKV